MARRITQVPIWVEQTADQVPKKGNTTVGVGTVSNSDGTLTISPTAGAVVASLNLANANVWTVVQTIQTGALGTGAGTGQFKFNQTANAANAAVAAEWQLAGSQAAVVSATPSSFSLSGFAANAAYFYGSGTATNGTYFGSTAGTVKVFTGGDPTAATVWTFGATRHSCGISNNGDVSTLVQNTSTGTSAYAASFVMNSNGSNYVGLYKLSTGYTTSGLLVADRALLVNQTGELVIANAANAAILFAANGSELARLNVASGLTLKPVASTTPGTNGDLQIEATSNTTLTLKYKGSDGTVRTVALTLA